MTQGERLRASRAGRALLVSKTAEHVSDFGATESWFQGGDCDREMTGDRSRRKTLPKWSYQGLEP